MQSFLPAKMHSKLSPNVNFTRKEKYKFAVCNQSILVYVQFVTSLNHTVGELCEVV